MERLIEIKNDYNSLDKLKDVLEKTNGQMAECLLFKKNGMHALKVFFVNENTIKINHIIPNKMMNAYFGKSAKAYKNIIEIVAGGLKNVLLKGAQEKAFKDMEQVFHKILV